MSKEDGMVERLDDLPAVIGPLPELAIPPSTDLSESATDIDALKADLPMANAVLQAVHVCWGEVKSIKGVSNMIKMTIEATKHRRDVLGIRYGARAEGDGKSGLVYPID